MKVNTEIAIKLNSESVWGRVEYVDSGMFVLAVPGPVFTAKFVLPCARFDSSAARDVAPSARRGDAEILTEAGTVYQLMAPESLSCGGRCSIHEQREERARLSFRLRALECEIGRKIKKGEALSAYMASVV